MQLRPAVSRGPRDFFKIFVLRDVKEKRTYNSVVAENDQGQDVVGRKGRKLRRRLLLLPPTLPKKGIKDIGFIHDYGYSDGSSASRMHPL